MKKLILALIAAVVVIGGVVFWVLQKRSQPPVTPHDQPPQNMSDANNSPEDIMASLDALAYGYDVSVFINGQDIGIKGGKSESVRLFNSGNPAYKNAPAAVKSQLGVLKTGQNTIKVVYKRRSGEDTTGLSVDLLVRGYPLRDDSSGLPEPLFSLKVDSKESGVVERTVNIQIPPPPDFKPVVITE